MYVVYCRCYKSSIVKNVPGLILKNKIWKIYYIDIVIKSNAFCVNILLLLFPTLIISSILFTILQFRATVDNHRPAGQIRPASYFTVARKNNSFIQGPKKSF